MAYQPNGQHKMEDIPQLERPERFKQAKENHSLICHLKFIQAIHQTVCLEFTC